MELLVLRTTGVVLQQTKTRTKAISKKEYPDFLKEGAA